MLSSRAVSFGSVLEVWTFLMKLKARRGAFPLPVNGDKRNRSKAWASRRARCSTFCTSRPSDPDSRRTETSASNTRRDRASSRLVAHDFCHPVDPDKLGDDSSFFAVQ